MTRARIVALLICLAPGLCFAGRARRGYGLDGRGDITIFYDGFDYPPYHFYQPDLQYSHPESGYPRWRSYPDPVPTPTRRPLIQMALVLDTSDGMTGLINQAGTELWSVVNGLISARIGNASAKLEVVLYEYGSDQIGAESEYMRQVVPFTAELDRVSEQLFDLKATGDARSCSRAVRQAAGSLDWSPHPTDLKLLFVAGGESLSLDPAACRDAFKAAGAKGISVHAIHCMTNGAGPPQLKDAADLTGEAHAKIDQSHKIHEIATPHDIDILTLSRTLNGTYIAFGPDGALGIRRQQKQDQNVNWASRAAAIQRALAKASRYYRNDTWDLIDAVRAEHADLSRVRAAELPPELHRMTRAQIAQYVNSMALRRDHIRQQIRDLNDKRQAYVARRRFVCSDRPDTLGPAMLRAILKHGCEKGFEFSRPGDFDRGHRRPGSVIITWQGRDKVLGTRYRIITAEPLRRR